MRGSPQRSGPGLGKLVYHAGPEKSSPPDKKSPAMSRPGRTIPQPATEAGKGWGAPPEGSLDSRRTMGDRRRDTHTLRVAPRLTILGLSTAAGSPHRAPAHTAPTARERLAKSPLHPQPGLGLSPAPAGRGNGKGDWGEAAAQISGSGSAQRPDGSPRRRKPPPEESAARAGPREHHGPGGQRHPKRGPKAALPPGAGAPPRTRGGGDPAGRALPKGRAGDGARATRSPARGARSAATARPGQTRRARARESRGRGPGDEWPSGRAGGEPGAA